PALRRVVLLGFEPDGEETNPCYRLDPAAPHNTLGESARRIFRRNRLADYLCDWSGGRRADPSDETEWMVSSAKVFVDRWGVCHRKARQSLCISLACPRWPISRGILLFAAHQ